MGQWLMCESQHPGGTWGASSDPSTQWARLQGSGLLLQGVVVVCDLCMQDQI
jgi:hypothetical protein